MSQRSAPMFAYSPNRLHAMCPNKYPSSVSMFLLYRQRIECYSSVVRIPDQIIYGLLPSCFVSLEFHFHSTSTGYLHMILFALSELDHELVMQTRDAEIAEARSCQPGTRSHSDQPQTHLVLVPPPSCHLIFDTIYDQRSLRISAHR